MALNPMILLGGVALIMLMGGRRAAARRPEPEIKRPKRPPPPPPSEKPPLVVTPSGPPEEIVVALEDYRLPEGYSFPPTLRHESLWISDDCMAWALGRDFKKKMPPQSGPAAFYNQAVDRLVDQGSAFATIPPDEWTKFSFDPEWNEGPPFDGPGIAWVRSLLASIGDAAGEGGAACLELLPLPQDYPDRDSYFEAWEQFTQDYPSAWALIYNLWKSGREAADKAWDTRFPDESAEWDMREWATRAVEEQASLNLEDKTDWAYHHAFPDCPEVIDPNNPEHDECKDLWLLMRQYIQEAS